MPTKVCKKMPHEGKSGETVLLIDQDTELWLFDGKHKQKLSEAILPVAFELPGETND